MIPLIYSILPSAAAKVEDSRAETVLKYGRVKTLRGHAQVRPAAPEGAQGEARTEVQEIEHRHRGAKPRSQ